MLLIPRELTKCIKCNLCNSICQMYERNVKCPVKSLTPESHLTTPRPGQLRSSMYESKVCWSTSSLKSCLKRRVQLSTGIISPSFSTSAATSFSWVPRATHTYHHHCQHEHCNMNWVSRLYKPVKNVWDLLGKENSFHLPCSEWYVCLFVFMGIQM